MSAAEIKTEAIVLRRFDFSESSQVGHLYTRSLGRLAALAKGIKRPGSELRGPMDLFARASTALRLRRGELQLLVRYRVVDGYRGLRRSSLRLNAAFYVTELLREGTRDMDPQTPLFDLTTDTLAVLSEAGPKEVAALVLGYELGYLRLAGFLPDFRRCVACGLEAPPGVPVRLSAAQAGLLCRRCAARQGGRLITIDRHTRAHLVALLEARAPAAAGQLCLSSSHQQKLRGLLSGTLERVLEKELKSARFLGGP